MTKGFGKPKDDAITATRQFIKAINRMDLVAIEALNQRWGKQLGTEKLANIVTEEVLVEVSEEAHSWFLRYYLGQQKYEEFNAVAQEAVVSELIEGGFVLGKDFSIDTDRSLIMNEKAQSFLLNLVPKKHQKKAQKSMKRVDRPDPIEALEKQLGLPFFENLAKVGAERVAGLTNGEIQLYIGWMIEGLEKRHPALKDTDILSWLIAQFVRKDKQLFDAIGEGNPDDVEAKDINLFIWMDLLKAMGRDDLRIDDNGQWWISKEDLQRLDKVWTGEEMSFRELIAKIEKAK